MMVLNSAGQRLSINIRPPKQTLWPRPKFTTLLILLRAECHHVAPGAVIVDPMCGSGTILIEAALMASHIAPGAHFVTILVHAEAVRSTWAAASCVTLPMTRTVRHARGNMLPMLLARGNATHSGRACCPRASRCTMHRRWCEILLPKTSDVILYPI